MIQQFHSWVFNQKVKYTNKKRYMHSNVHNSIIFNSQDMETTQGSINRWINKEDVDKLYIKI